jgi:hypothetical protein
MTPSNRDPIQFTRESGERIARVVRAAELEVPPGSPLTYDPILQGQRKVFHVGTFAGAWAIGSANTVTLASGVTLAAQNLFINHPNLGTRSCAVGKDGTAWYLVQWRWDFESGGGATNIALSGASLGTSSLTFSRIRVPYLGTASTLSISVTTCSTAAS